MMKATGKSLDEVLDDAGRRSGLLGLSGVSGDIRDWKQAAEAAIRAQLALDVFHAEIRRYLGGLLVELGGADVIVFTGGIGENGVQTRSAVCAGLEELGIVLDREGQRRGGRDSRQIWIRSCADSRTQIWVVPTNEELIVARQAKAAVDGAGL
jgi:acetate kinase